MKTIKFKRFTKLNFLKQIGRDLLGQFFNRYNHDLAEKGVVMPAATLDDDAYFGAVAKIALSPEGLPGDLVDDAHAIEAMTNEEGQERLEHATGENGLAFQFRENSSCAEIAMQAWLTNPEVFAEKLNEQRLTRLASFDYFSSKHAMDQSGTFATPSARTLELITADLEQVFRAKNRGQQTTRVELFPMDGEHWFLIRHGDTYAMMPTVANGQLTVLHFRPAKDDVVVYAPERDEIRIHAGAKWEKELYQETFGNRLFGDDRHFSERKAYTLDPLRADGADALDASDIPGITRIVLREIEVAWPGEFGDSRINKSTDVFESAKSRGGTAISESGRLVRAAFEFYFDDSPKPRKVQVRPPNVLKLGRHCDAALVQRWLTERGFRETVNAAQPRGGITHVEPLALP
jgi:hypothetical protein